MSVCRFSCNGWASDIYCYESDRGFEIHIAGARRPHRVLRALRLARDAARDSAAANGAVADAAWVAGIVAESRELAKHEDAPLIRIDHPEAGGNIFAADAAGCLVELRRLRDVGFHVPSHAIAGLEEDVALAKARG